MKLLDKQKIFLEGAVRTCVFIVAIRELSGFVLNKILYPIIESIGFYTSILLEIKPNFISDKFAELLIIPIIFIISCVLFILTTYLVAKLCGIYKYFSQFKFWKSRLFLIIISVLAECFCYLNLHTFAFKLIDSAVKFMGKIQIVFSNGTNKFISFFIIIPKFYRAINYHIYY